MSTQSHLRRSSVKSCCEPFRDCGTVLCPGYFCGLSVLIHAADQRAAFASATVRAAMLMIRRTVADGVRTCTGSAAPKQHRADGDASAGGGLEQVVGDVGGVDVGQHPAGSPRPSAGCDGISSATVVRRRGRCRRASRRRPRATTRVCPQQSPASSRIFTADGWLLRAEVAECESSAAFGAQAEAHHLFGSHHRDLGQLLCGRVGS